MTQQQVDLNIPAQARAHWQKVKPYALKTWAFLLAVWRFIRPVLPIIGKALLLVLQVLSMVFLALLDGILGVHTKRTHAQRMATRRQMGER